MPQSWLIRADSILVGSGLAFLFLLKGQSAGSWAAPPHLFGDSSNITTDIGRKIQRNYTTSDGLLTDHLLYRPSTCIFRCSRTWPGPPDSSQCKHATAQPLLLRCCYEHFSQESTAAAAWAEDFSFSKKRSHICHMQKKKKKAPRTRRLCSSLQNPVAVSLKNIFSA